MSEFVADQSSIGLFLAGSILGRASQAVLLSHPVLDCSSICDASSGEAEVCLWTASSRDDVREREQRTEDGTHTAALSNQDGGCLEG